MVKKPHKKEHVIVMYAYTILDYKKLISYLKKHRIKYKSHEDNLAVVVKYTERLADYAQRSKFVEVYLFTTREKMKKEKHLFFPPPIF